MKKLTTFAPTVALTLSLALLASCGGSSSSSSSRRNSSTGNQSGQFVDSFVAGLRYESGAQVGITSSSGSFECETGQKVSFYLDQDEAEDMLLGEVECRGVVSPIELVTDGQQDITVGISALAAAERQKATNLLRLLQSLDLDRDLSNGIFLETSMLADVVAHLKANAPAGEEADAAQSMLALSSAQFSVALNNLLAAIGRPGTAVTEGSAVAHFETFRQNCTKDSCEVQSGQVPESQHICLSGYTFAREDDPYIYDNIVDTSTGQVYAQYTSNYAIVPTLLVLKEDQEVRIYRRITGSVVATSPFANDAYYTSFQGTWDFDSDTDVLTVTDVEFKNETPSFTFESVVNLGVSTIIMTDNSSGAPSQGSPILKTLLKTYSVSYNCELPAEDDTHNLGDGSN